MKNNKKHILGVITGLLLMIAIMTDLECSYEDQAKFCKHAMVEMCK